MKKIALNGVSTTPRSARPNHPVVHVGDEAEALLAQFVTINPQYKLLKNQSETLAKQIAPHIKSTFFTRYNGITPESSTMLVQINGQTIKLTTKNAYSSQCNDETLIIGAIGQELTDRHFRQATELKIDLTKCGDDDKAETFAERVLALRAELGLPEETVTAKQSIQPRAGFHESRTSILTPEQNLALDSVLPITAYPQL